MDAEVEKELSLAQSSDVELATGRPVSEWLFDPIDVEREELGIPTPLGAAEELEAAPRPRRHGTGGGAGSVYTGEYGAGEIPFR